MDSLILRSKTVRRKISDENNLAEQIKQLFPLLPEIDENKNLPIKMATKDDITEMVKYHRTKKVFEPQYFGGKTTENEKEFLSSFNNYCKLNKIDGQEKILMFEMSLSGAAKCWYSTLSDTIKKDFESLTEKFNHDYLQNNKWLNTTRLENRKLLNTESAEKYISDMSDLALLVGIGEEELSKALIRGLPAKLRWHVVSFNPTTLSETIQRILLGEATLSFDDNEHINVVSENGMATTVQRMDERLDKLEDLLKSCQLPTTTYPAEQNDQPLQSSSYGNPSWVNQRFSNNSRNYNNDNLPNRRYNDFYSQRVERGNTFQPRAIRGSYNPRYYSGGERGYNRSYNQTGGFQKNSIPPRV